MSRIGRVLPVLAIALLLAGSVGSASAATPGFAMYRVTLAAQGHSYSFTVNETIAKTSDPDYQTLIVEIATSGSTFNYSRSINASEDISPFLPAITNQTFSYGSSGGAASLNIQKNGTRSLEFGGSTHTLTTYSLSGSFSVNGSSTTIDGWISTFSSGLVDSASIAVSYPTPGTLGIGDIFPGLNSTELQEAGQAGALSALQSLPAEQGTASLSVVLLSTSLPLNSASASTTARVVSVGVGAGAVVSALAVGLEVRRRSKHTAPVAETKPEHWVD